MSSDDANASLVSRERVSADAEPGREGGDDRRADALGHEGGDDDHEREERDERLAGEGDAAIDELDLEHALPHPPEQQTLQPFPQYGDAAAHFDDAGVRRGGGLVRQMGSISQGRQVLSKNDWSGL